MLFNSYPFLFVFLPIALAGFELTGRLGRRPVILWLGLCSLAFYAYWNPPYVLLLLASVAFNYTAATLIARRTLAPRATLIAGIAANLLALCYYKYLFPLLGLPAVTLPLGISFFTFTQIAYLVDLEQQAATQESPVNYLLFVTFFPHLIAGPILHHSEMMPQFKRTTRYRLHLPDVVVGLTWFILGLGKKVIFAEAFAQTADAVYGLPSPIPALLAWRGVLAYGLQLYFDFSGYSDMACGLARMFSIDFPLNFASPYKAVNIIDYWARWHITLTRYVTAYLYNPTLLWISRRRMAGGRKTNRKALLTPGGFTQMLVLPMVVTFGITGIWHGAGSKFLVFGLVHAGYLIANHAWRLVRSPRLPANAITRGASVLLTFLAVLAAQTFFRGASTRQAVSLLGSMAGLHHLGSPHIPNESTAAMLSDLLEAAGGLAIVWLLPNTQQILRRFHPGLALTPWDETPSRPHWLPNYAWTLATAALALTCLVRMQNTSSFLYFQF